MRIRVDCYAGYRGEERPLRFQLGEVEFEVRELLDQWYGPDDRYFRVRANDGNLYILRHDEHNGGWTLESFRRSPAAAK